MKLGASFSEPFLRARAVASSGRQNQKDFYDSGTALVSQATPQSHKKVFWLLFFKKVTAFFVFI
jgi:hypothetical protein